MNLLPWPSAHPRIAGGGGTRSRGAPRRSEPPTPELCPTWDRVSHGPGRARWGASQLLLAAALALTSCQRSAPAEPGVTLATTTSYLEAIARDLLGDHVRVLRLAEPGACPGHFDIRPSQVQELRQCRVLLRFDFQKSLDARLAGPAGTGPVVAEVAPGSGLARPDRYLAASRQAAEHFVALGLIPRPVADARLAALAARLDALTRDTTLRVQQAALSGVPVIASGHQREFCEWLGLEVVTTFRAADTASIREIEAALAAGKLTPVQWVIANRPEGRRTADALAEHLGARVIVFDNFPPIENRRVRFDDLLLGNVAALLQASGNAGPRHVGSGEPVSRSDG